MRLTADNFQYIQSDAFVQIPFLDRDGDHKTTHEQENDPVHVLPGDIGENDVEIRRGQAIADTYGSEIYAICCGQFPPAHNTQQRECDYGYQCRRGQRDRLCNPPDSHEYDYCDHSRHQGIARLQIDEEQYQQKYRGSKPEPNAAS